MKIVAAVDLGLSGEFKKIHGHMVILIRVLSASLYGHHSHTHKIHTGIHIRITRVHA